MSGISYSMPRFQAIDMLGRPMVGATLYTYQNKTTTPAPTWRDKDQAAYNTNPVVLDARGEAVIWLDPAQVYTFVLKGSFGEVAWTQDDVAGAASQIDLKQTVSKSISEHNHRTDAHPELSSFISKEADRATSAADSAAASSSAEPYQTLSDLISSPSPPAGWAVVINDPIETNNGFYSKAGSTWVKTGFQAALSSDLKVLGVDVVDLSLKTAKKLDEHSSPAPGVLASITDKDGRPTFMTARDTDGAPADVATHLIGLVLGLLFEPTPGYMLALVDAQRRMTDLAIRDSDGQFDDFVVDRLAPRIAQRLNPQDLGKVIPFPQVIGSDHPVLGSDFYMRDGELLPVLSNMARFAGWGSSSMSRSSAAMSALAVSLGSTYFDGAVPGQGSEQISARLGSVPAFCTFPNNMIPAGTEEISIVVPDIGWHAGQDYTGTINGVHGRLRYSGGPKFSRTTAGAAVPVEPKTPFLPDAGAQNRASITFLWMGRNDLSATDDRTESCIKNTDRSFDWLAPLVKRVLVLGHFKGDLTPDSPVWDRIERVNTAHRLRYGRLFVDVNAYLVSPQVWIDMSLTPTQQDLDQQAVGTTPASLRVDGLHLTNAAYQAVVTHCVRARMVELGWI